MVDLRVPLDFNVHKDLSYMVVRTPTNIIRLVANFVSHRNTTFYHLCTTFLVCQIYLVVNVVEGCKLIKNVYLIRE